MNIASNRYIRCPKCDEYHWAIENCKPIFFVYIHDNDGVMEYAHKVRGIDHEDAAAKLLTIFNAENEDCFINKDITMDCVRDDDGIKKRFKMRLEYEVTIGSSEEINITEPSNTEPCQ